MQPAGPLPDRRSEMIIAKGSNDCRSWLILILYFLCGTIVLCAHYMKHLFSLVKREHGEGLKNACTFRKILKFLTSSKIKSTTWIYTAGGIRCYFPVSETPEAQCLWNALARSVIGISCEDRVTNIEIMRRRGLQAETPWRVWWVCAWLKINMFRRWWNGFQWGKKIDSDSLSVCKKTKKDWQSDTCQHWREWRQGQNRRVSPLFMGYFSIQGEGGCGYEWRNAFFMSEPEFAPSKAFSNM